MTDMRNVANVLWCLKTLRFPSFHSSHVTSMTMLAMALRGMDGVVAVLDPVLDHHRATLSLGCHSCGRKVGCAVYWALRFHILPIYLHSARRLM
jgi:hypothetical protein